MGAEDEIDDRIGFLELFGHMGLLHHASADRDDLPRPGLLRVVEGADVPEHAHLGMLADRTGVDHDDVGLKFVLRKAAAHLPQVPAQLFAVRLVLLTAVGVHQGEGLHASGGEPVKKRMTDLNLALDFFLRNGFSFDFQCDSPTVFFRTSSMACCRQIILQPAPGGKQFFCRFAKIRTIIASAMLGKNNLPFNLPFDIIQGKLRGKLKGMLR